MPYAKKVNRKVSRRKLFRRGLKARYQTSYKGKKAYNIGGILRDVQYLKGQINAEHKHIDTVIGGKAGATFSAQYPTNSTPIVIALNMPARGTNYNNRVGNQIVINHITAKYRLTFQNNNDLITTNTIRARIVFAKDADSVPAIANLLEKDANDHYTPMSFTNAQEYRKFIWMKSLDVLKHHKQKFVYNEGSYTGTPNASSRQTSEYYPMVKTSCRIKAQFDNGADTSSVNKPYLVLTSDIIDAATDYDLASLTGTIRISYLDN